MTANELRKKYLEFFKEKGHAIIPSASLIPENDPTVLFTTAGMHPLVSYLLGQKHPMGSRLADAQKCVRTGDIDDVGDNRHLTFFEMLGNWSLGDYFKKEAIEWSWEFLTDKNWLGLEPQRLYATVFMGDENSPQDQESIDIWRKQFFKAGIEAEVCEYDASISGNKNYRIFPLPAKDNWWGPAGQTGPCGPCTEMFYDVEPDGAPLEGTFDEEVDKFRIMEIWNDVFMEYNKKAKNPPPARHATFVVAGGQPPFVKGGDRGAEYEFEKLAQKNVDTGMGLERTIAVLSGRRDVFDSDLFYPIIEKIEELAEKGYNSPPARHATFVVAGGQPPLNIRGGEENPPEPSLKGGREEIMKAMRIIADHLKAAAFILAEGLEPSNTERGYVLRRLIRRAIRYGRQLGVKDIFTFKVVNVVVEMYRDVYPELFENRAFIEEQLIREEEKFGRTLAKGLKEFQNQILKIKNQKQILKKGKISGKMAFNLYQTYGFPVELTVELAKEENFDVDIAGFGEALKKHQELSRAGAEQKFKGGLADHSAATTKYHTATHLLLAALRKIFGEHVYQKGSNITAERLRFDFSHSQKLSSDELSKVENLVNEKIQEDLSVQMQEMSLDDAKTLGAIGVFEAKYGDKVKVYTIGQSDKILSREICGGPHIERTGQLGHFRIIREEAVSAGVRRIKAALE